MLAYPSGLDLSTSTLRLLRQELAARRRLTGTRWRRLTCGRQALLSLAHLRCGHTFAQPAAGFGIGLATAHRYVTEAVDVLAALASTLQEAMTVAATPPPSHAGPVTCNFRLEKADCQHRMRRGDSVRSR